MTESATSVTILSQLSQISPATIGRARAGKELKRETQVALFDALAALKKCQFITSLRSRLLVDKSDAKADPTLRAAIMAAFNN